MSLENLRQKCRDFVDRWGEQAQGSPLDEFYTEAIQILDEASVTLANIKALLELIDQIKAIKFMTEPRSSGGESETPIHGS